MYKFGFILTSTLLVTGLTLTSEAQAQECTFQASDTADFNLSEDLAGTSVSLTNCNGETFLFAALNIGDAEIGVSGPWLGNTAATCLKSHFEESPWFGFLDAVQSVSICYNPSDSSWQASTTTSASLVGGFVDIVDAAFDWSADAPTFSIGSLGFGPFEISDVELTTTIDEDGISLPDTLSGTLALAFPGGGNLQATGAVSADGFFEIGLELSSLPSDFPFPGISIPATKASIAFAESGWKFGISFSGNPSLGPLGVIPIDEGELSVSVPEHGNWTMSGCLSSSPLDIPLSILELSQTEVSVCASSDGDAKLEWQSNVTIAELGLGPVASEGSLVKDGVDYSGTLGFSGALPAGVLGDILLEGEFSLSGSNASNATLSGCVQTASTVSLAGPVPANFRFQLGNSCRPGPEFDFSFDGTVHIANQDIAASGSMSLGANTWSTEATLSNLAFGDYILNDATVNLDSQGNAGLVADLQIGAFPLQVSGQVKGSGNFSLNLALTSSVDLGNGLTIDNVSGSKLEFQNGVWSLLLKVAGGATIAGTDIDADGTLDATFDTSTGLWTLSGCMEMQTVPVGLPITATSGEVCWQGGEPKIRVSGTVDVGGTLVEVSGSYAPDPDADPQSAEMLLTLDLTSHDGKLVLGPGVELEQVALVVRPQSDAFDLSAKLCLGVLCMDVSGAYLIGGAGSLDLAMTVSGWQPFPQLQPFSGLLSGQIDIDSDNNVSLSYKVSSTQSYQIATGLQLTQLSAGGRVNSEGDWALQLGGTTALSFGETTFDLTLVGSVDSAGTWSFKGLSDISFQPLEGLLGEGAFIVANPAFEVVATQSQFSVAMQGELSMKLIPGAPAITTVVRGGITSGSSAGLWFAGSIDGLRMPGVGTAPWQLPALYFAASTTTVEDFDLFNTPNDTGDDLQLEQGVTLTTIAELPVALVPNQPSMRLAIHLGQEGLKLSGNLDNLGLELVTAEHNLPTIQSVVFDSMSMDASISTSGKLEMGFEGTTLFTPSNQSTSLLANARLEVGYMAPLVTVAGQMSIAGRWIEPFGIPRITIADPAFKLGFAVTTSYPPVPTLSAIGFNGDGYWLKTGDWPVGFENTEVPAPSNVVHAGSTFYFELEPKPSGICVGICLPLPPVIARISLNNLSLSELVEAANAIKEGVRDMVLAAAPTESVNALATALPQGSFSPIDIQPMDLSVNTLEFYLSTHNIEPWPGIAFESGVHANLDVELGNHQTVLKGKLGMDGLLLEGRVDPITVGDFSVTGNPHSKYADLSSRSYSSVRVTSPLDFSTGTIEGWVRTNGNRYGYLFHKNSATGSIRVGTTSAKKICDTSPCVYKARARLYISRGSQVQEILSDAILTPGQWYHLAAVVDDSEIRLLVDGSVVASATRDFDSSFTGYSYFGYSMNGIDDVRVWNSVRTLEDIASHLSSLPASSSEDSTLIARYEFDYDTPGQANNSKFYNGAKRHGSYYYGVPKLDERDQKLLLGLKLSLGEIEESGLTLQGGVHFDPLGGNSPIAFSTKVIARIGDVLGSLYSPRFTLLDIPSFGSFTLDGDGPNGHAGDFDDGVYAGFNLGDSEFQGSGRLVYTNSSNESSDVAQVQVRYQCPNGTSCTAGNGHKLDASGEIDLHAPIGALGEIRLSGNASYKSSSQELIISGQLRAFGQTMSSSEILLNQSGIHLQSTIAPGALVGLNLGSQSLAMDYQYQPARVCGNGTGLLRIPGTTTSFSSTTQVCFGSNPSLSIDGNISSLRLGGIDIDDVSIGYSNGRLNLSGQVAIPGVFSGTLSGWYRSPSDFSLTATSNVTLGGFAMSNAALTLSPSGFKANGSVDLKVAQVNANVAVNRYGSFSMSGDTALSFSGHNLANGHYNLNRYGLTVSGTANVMGNNWGLSGTVYSDGAYTFSANQNLTIQGFSMSSAQVSLARYTAAHPRQSGNPAAGLRAAGTLTLPYGNSASFSFNLSSNGNYSASSYQDFTLKGWGLSNGRIRLTQDSLTVRGTMTIPGGSILVDTRLYSNGYFSLTASPSLNIRGFGLTNGFVRFKSSNGLYIQGKAKMGTSRYLISGAIQSLNSFELCTSASSVSPTTPSYLPKLAGRFCLKNYGSGARITGQGTAQFHGRTFDSDFRMSTTGGIEYLYVSEQPNPFTLFGVSVGGRTKFKVVNNVLQYFRWTGSLYVPWPWGGTFLDIYKTVALSRFKLCPSDFISVTPPQFSNACAYLYF